MPTPAAESGAGQSDRKTFVLDTSVLLHNPDAIFKFEEHEVVIPLVVVEELDNYQTTNDERGRNARDVIRHLDRLRNRGTLSDGVQLNGEASGCLRIEVDHPEVPRTLDASKPANRVIAVANAIHKSGARTVFVTNNINSRVKCDTLGIHAEEFLHQRIDTAHLFNGWGEVSVPGEVIDELYDERQLPADRIEPFLTPGESATEPPFKPCANAYIILNNVADPSHHGLARLLADTDHYIPITNPRRPVYGIMPRNVQQTMALDLLLDDDVKLVTLMGAAGTGKTLLAVAAGMMKVYQEERFDKLLAARPIMPLGKDIGYLPGSKDEKLSLWMQPIFDNLAYLLSTRGTHFNDAESLSTEQRIDRMLEAGQLVIEPITYIRGRSIPHQFMIVDECQNLSPHEVKTIVSRVGDGTKIILTGDVYQIDNPYLDASSNGLSYVAEQMKNQRLSGHVTLTKSERSELASLAADLL